MRKLIIAGALLVASLAPAFAGVNCQTYGNQTYCQDDSGHQSTCSTYGNQTYCN
jgi:hypothetical protein